MEGLGREVQMEEADEAEGGARAGVEQPELGDMPAHAAKRPGTLGSHDRAEHSRERCAGHIEHCDATSDEAEISLACADGQAARCGGDRRLDKAPARARRRMGRGVRVASTGDRGAHIHSWCACVRMHAAGSGRRASAYAQKVRECM